MNGEGVAADATDVCRDAVQAHDCAGQLELRLLRVAVAADALEAGLTGHCGRKSIW